MCKGLTTIFFTISIAQKRNVVYRLAFISILQIPLRTRKVIKINHWYVVCHLYLLLYFSIFCNFKLCDILNKLCNIILCDILINYVTCHIKLCYILINYVTCHIKLCYILINYVTCHIKLCYIIFRRNSTKFDKLRRVSQHQQFITDFFVVLLLKFIEIRRNSSKFVEIRRNVT